MAYLFSAGNEDNIQVWRVKDSKRVAAISAGGIVFSLAVSKDGRWIAGELAEVVLVCDATTHEQVLSCQTGTLTHDVDFSPDSTRLVSTDRGNLTVAIWDITTRRKVRIFDHNDSVRAVRFSPQGDRIATATEASIRVWDSNNGGLLVIIEVGVSPSRGLLWFNNHLFVNTRDNKIKRIDASDGSIISEWSVTDNPRMALPQHGKFIACSTRDRVTFFGTSMPTQLGLIQQSRNKSPIAFSPDDELLAFVTQKGIVIQDLSLLKRLIHKEPVIVIENAPLDAWKHGQLTNAEALLNAAIPTSSDKSHYVLAARAIIRTRLRQWDAALADAEESIKVQSSVVGYIEKCVTLVRMGEKHKGYRVWDIASYHFHSNPDDVAILLLVKAVILSMAGEYDDAISRIDDLLSLTFLDPTLYVIQAYMYLLLGNSHMEGCNYERAIQSFEYARVKLGDRTDQPPLIVSLISGWNFDDLAITIQQRSCEALFDAGRTNEASESVLHMVDREVSATDPVITWALCLSVPENNDNTSEPMTCDDNIPMCQETSHASHPTMSLLREWVRVKLTAEPWRDALLATARFILSRFAIYQAICEDLEVTGHTADAVACFHQMYSELSWEMDTQQVVINWTRDFKYKCCAKLEDLGDHALDAKEYDQAISRFTVALSLNPAAPHDVLVKRSKAHAGKGMWVDALNDANEVLRVDPSSPSGYETKHAALHGLERYSDAISAFETMLSKMSESSNPMTREQSYSYVTRQQTTETIRATIQGTIRDSPLVLINTASGRLYNKSDQAAAFESELAFTKLISSMTTHIDHAFIEEEVRKFYRYATFSHKWEENEPLYEMVVRTPVYNLAASPAHEKLQTFCKIVREAGFRWAWSDTCCINKADHFVLQEALVSMFKWYQGSAMTIIFLLGVGRLAKRGSLAKSIWNMRAWTLQEYHASKVVRFYTQDWTLYLGIDLYNHKDSPEIVSEMEEATSVSARALTSLHPGLDDIREKLCLASMRQTTRVEDTAYSLLGIFSISLPVVYGEGDKALGRLLVQLLASSGDMSILAWTGVSGSFNSCLPTSIAVFREPSATYIPSAIVRDEMRPIAAGLHSLDLALVINLYDRVNELSVPSFSGYRMKLPCLVFKLGRVSVLQNGAEQVFYAQANVLGVVEIRSDEDLSEMDSLYLIHPWIDFLLDRQLVYSTKGKIEEGMDDDSFVLQESPSFSPTQEMRTTSLIGRLGRTFGRRPIVTTPEKASLAPPSAAWAGPSDIASLSPPSTLSPAKKQMRALQFIARLKRPFGALLLVRTRQNMEEYKRVATASLIRVQVQEITPAILDRLMQSVRMLDVL